MNLFHEAEVIVQPRQGNIASHQRFFGCSVRFEVHCSTASVLIDFGQALTGSHGVRERGQPLLSLFFLSEWPDMANVVDEYFEHSEHSVSEISVDYDRGRAEV